MDKTFDLINYYLLVAHFSIRRTPFFVLPRSIIFNINNTNTPMPQNSIAGAHSILKKVDSGC